MNKIIFSVDDRVVDIRKDEVFKAVDIKYLTQRHGGTAKKEEINE